MQSCNDKYVACVDKCQHAERPEVRVQSERLRPDQAERLSRKRINRLGPVQVCSNLSWRCELWMLKILAEKLFAINQSGALWFEKCLRQSPPFASTPSLIMRFWLLQCVNLKAKWNYMNWMDNFSRDLLSDVAKFAQKLKEKLAVSRRRQVEGRRRWFFVLLLRRTRRILRDLRAAVEMHIEASGHRDGHLPRWGFSDIFFEFLAFLTWQTFADLPSSTRNEKNSVHGMSSKNCLQPVKVEPGCEIVDRKCECWRQPIEVCRENFIRWDFANIQVMIDFSLMQPTVRLKFSPFIWGVDWAGVWVEFSEHLPVGGWVRRGLHAAAIR